MFNKGQAPLGEGLVAIDKGPVLHSKGLVSPDKGPVPLSEGLVQSAREAGASLSLQPWSQDHPLPNRLHWMPWGLGLLFAKLLLSCDFYNGLFLCKKCLLMAALE